MKVILTKDVPGIGRSGDVKEVSDGYARNFLIPKHFGLPATSSALAKVQKEEQDRIAKVAKELEKFKVLIEKLQSKTFTIKARAQKNNLFAAVREKDIAKLINEKLSADILPEAVVIDKPLKSLGLHEIEIRFAKDLVAVVKFNLEAL